MSHRVSHSVTEISKIFLEVQRSMLRWNIASFWLARNCVKIDQSREKQNIVLGLFTFWGSWQNRQRFSYYPAKNLEIPIETIALESPQLDSLRTDYLVLKYKITAGYVLTDIITVRRIGLYRVVKFRGIDRKCFLSDGCENT